MDNILIWAAGFMDGEGTFTLKRIRYKGGIYHQPYITCAQTIKSQSAIYKLKEIFGGSIYKYHQKGQKMDTLQWTVASKKARSCAEKLIPYLLLKKQQAKLIIRFYDTLLVREKQYKLTQDDYNKREKLFAEMRKLNVKGKLRFAAETTKRENSNNGDAIV